MRLSRTGFLSALLLLGASLTAQGAMRADADLAALSLEELMALNVRLPLRVSRPLFATPSAVYVLDSARIRRSGASSIPELLRLVPGVEVTRFGSGKWGIGIRGFNGGVFTNRLLILMDGRSVFSPAKVGMFWDTLDTLIEDIERIVVVRGPGAALWGSNAINGVINIVTRSPQSARGGLVSVGTGTHEKTSVGLRLGKAVGPNRHLRAYLKAFERKALQRPDGRSNDDPWRAAHAGFRLDWHGRGQNRYSVQSDAYSGRARETILLPQLRPMPGAALVNDRVSYSGISLQSAWERPWNSESDTQLRLFYDHSQRRDVLFDLSVDTIDVDFQHDLRLGDTRRLSWGLGYRLTWDDLPDRYLRFAPQRRHYAVQSAYLQLEQNLDPAGLDLIAGAKLEHNAYSGAEIQPNLRLLWSTGPSASAWLAVSQAHRSPSRTEHDVTIDFDLVPLDNDQLLQLQIRGDEGFRAEQLTAYELGWRHRSGPQWSLDAAVFLNRYRGLRTLEPGDPEPASDPPPDFYLPLRPENRARARSWGGELVLRSEPRSTLALELSYAYIRIDVDASRSQDRNAGNAAKESPRHRVNFSLDWDVSPRLAARSLLRRVGPVPRHGIEAYTELDLSLSHRFASGLELQLLGSNLLHAGHQEFVDPVVGTPRVEVPRELRLKLTKRF